MILINFQKTFNTITHDILLRKLSTIGSYDVTIKWFQPYLLNQNISYNFRKFHSEILSILCGVQQASKPVPLLFLIYVNDMVMAVKCNLFLFADDSCSVFQSINVKDIKTFEWKSIFEVAYYTKPDLRSLWLMKLAEVH